MNQPAPDPKQVAADAKRELAALALAWLKMLAGKR